MIIFGFKEAIWKNKPIFDDLEVYEPVNLDISKTKQEPCKCKKCRCDIVLLTNLKIFDFKEENRKQIINYLKNKGFKYHFLPQLKDRLIFKYKVCLFE
jgi:hypothetical protein